ncbi:hypothetical protein NKJ88_06285 [Mesorhizobium sp. M0016]|uniref:hypothetical protein n=1 Tax=Mesorhizobium sp. M0016 TaxID=2956843 RepID=UPI00333D6F1B
MEQNLKVQANIVAELLQIERKLAPLEARKEELKEAIRGFGADTYPFPGIGEVTVSEPSVSVKKSTVLTVDQSVLPKLTKETFQEVFEKGFVAYEDVMTRAAKSRVEVKLAA